MESPKKTLTQRHYCAFRISGLLFPFVFDHHPAGRLSSLTFFDPYMDEPSEDADFVISFQEPQLLDGFIELRELLFHLAIGIDEESQNRKQKCRYQRGYDNIRKEHAKGDDDRKEHTYSDDQVEIHALSG